MKEDPPSAFPILDTSAIEKHLADDEANTASATVSKASQLSFDKVPYGSGEFSFQTRHFINIRKLEVLHDCVAYIFENKISEARKVWIFYIQGVSKKSNRATLRCNCALITGCVNVIFACMVIKSKILD